MKEVNKVNENEKKPKRTRCEVYSRIVGYIRPINQWNKGKAEEFKDRNLYDKSVKENKEK